jgi:3,4-dihydroxy-2-butanone 4-phosphate synthase
VTREVEDAYARQRKATLIIYAIHTPSTLPDVSTSSRARSGSGSTRESVVALAAAALARDELIVVHDDRACAMAIAARAADAAVVARFVRQARGIVSVAMTGERLDALELPVQADDQRRANFAVSVDALEGTTTGISAADRAKTIQALLEGDRAKLGVPGHIIPVRTADGGTLERARISEACVDLARMTGLEPVVAVCAILADDGEALRPDQLSTTPALAGLVAVSARAVRAHRLGTAVDATAAPEPFREAMSLLASGVAAVTVADAAGRPSGLLATAVSSYSDDPPSVLISVAHEARTHRHLLDAERLGVHLLARGQADVARKLAGKADDKFSTLAWCWDEDVPHLDSTLVYLRCRPSAKLTHYDHTVLIADVEAIEVRDAAPLLYFRRALGWRLSETGQDA